MKVKIKMEDGKVKEFHGLFSGKDLQKIRDAARKLELRNGIHTIEVKDIKNAWS